VVISAGVGGDYCLVFFNTGHGITAKIVQRDLRNKAPTSREASRASVVPVPQEIKSYPGPGAFAPPSDAAPRDGVGRPWNSGRGVRAWRGLESGFGGSRNPTSQ
jgi:hypothetical protein